MTENQQKTANQEFLELLMPIDTTMRKLLLPLLMIMIFAWYFYGMPYPLIPLALLFCAYYIFGELNLWAIRRASYKAESIYFIYLLSNCLLLFLGIHLSGGIFLSFMPAVYILVGIKAGLTLPIWGILGIISAVILSYYGELFLEISGKINPIDIYSGSLSPQMFISSNYIFINPVALVTIFISATFLAHSVSKVIKSQKQKLLGLNQELDSRIGQLVELREGLVAKVKERTAEIQGNLLKLDNSRAAMFNMLKDVRRANQVKDEFLTIVSHELRTPLTPLIDYIHILREGALGKLTSGQLEVLTSAQSLANRELNLINSLLDVSRLESGAFKPQKTPIFVGRLIEDILSNFKDEAQAKNIQLNIVRMVEETILADENLLVRALSQLIENALKFTPKGGFIKIGAISEEGAIRFEVEDSGVGVVPANLTKIFEKFYQEDSSYTRRFGGMGMGLTIVKQIVTAHHGKIWAESIGLGHGLKIVFTLPVA